MNRPAKVFGSQDDGDWRGAQCVGQKTLGGSGFVRALVTAPHISSLRSTGRKFFLVRQFKNDFQEICLWHFGQDEAPDRDEMGLLHSIVQSNLLARRIAAWGFQAAIRQTMKPTLVKRYKHASSSGRV